MFGYATYHQVMKLLGTPVVGSTDGNPGKQPEASTMPIVFDVPSGMVSSLYGGTAPLTDQCVAAPHRAKFRE